MTVVGAHRTHLRASAGPRVAGLLAGPLREVPVVHRGRDAVYLEVDGWCLGVVSGPATRVPCALGVGGPVPLDGVTSAVVGERGIALGGVGDVRVGRLVDTTVPKLRPPVAEVRQFLDHCAQTAATELGSLVEHVGTAPERLIGLGSGLTPLGDDVLAGWAAASYALGAPVTLPDARPRTTLLSATLLDCAQRGEVLPEFRALVVALHGGDHDDIGDAAAELVAVGHTSGAGLLLGACLRWEAAA
jgi:hypothetical protein